MRLQSMKLLANNLRKSCPSEVWKGTLTGWLLPCLLKALLVLYLITISVCGSVSLSACEVFGF